MLPPQIVEGCPEVDHGLRPVRAPQPKDGRDPVRVELAPHDPLPPPAGTGWQRDPDAVKADRVEAVQHGGQMVAGDALREEDHGSSTVDLAHVVGGRCPRS